MGASGADGMQTIWVTGEALIDFIPVPSDLGGAFAPMCGGSTYNAAKAAAALGGAVQFVGALSSDMFGARLSADLAAYGVGLAHRLHSSGPTTLAFVEYDGRDARYAFFNTGSATQNTDLSGFTGDIKAGDVVHVGSISLIDNPAADRIADFALAQGAGVLLSIDPNVRAGMIDDRAAWQARMGRLLARADVVKLSVEDLAYMAPNLSPEQFAAQQLARRAGLVVVTLGAEGIFLATRAAQLSLPAHSRDVRDTVGAGDTVTGALLSDITARAIASGAALSALGEDDLRAMGRRAMVAAWLNCQHIGCAPPRLAQVLPYLAQ
jgi:fructokinase